METPLIGISPAIERIRKMIDRISRTKLPVLISGESGVGKEVVANNLYHRSERCRKPMVKINCAALPEGLLESELFGYEPGAFTGAQKRKRGKFEISDGGLLIMDEIGDMPLFLQAKLLHALQSGEYTPLGSEKQVQTDVWVICLTNHDLESDMREKLFREDLYYRISAINIRIPPLRERKEDIRPLIEYFVREYSTRTATGQIFTPRNIDRLRRHAWPGNVRELQNVIKRMLILDSPEEVLDGLVSCAPAGGQIPAQLGKEEMGKFFLKNLLKSEWESGGCDGLSLKQVRQTALSQIEKAFIATVLEKTDWNRTKASKILKVSYKTLLNKMKELDLVRD